MLRMMLSPLRVTETPELPGAAQLGFLIVHIEVATPPPARAPSPAPTSMALRV
jgi:hypothetical protein